MAENATFLYWRKIMIIFCINLPQQNPPSSRNRCWLINLSEAQRQRQRGVHENKKKGISRWRERKQKAHAFYPQTSQNSAWYSWQLTKIEFFFFWICARKATDSAFNFVFSRWFTNGHWTGLDPISSIYELQPLCEQNIQHIHVGALKRGFYILFLCFLFFKLTVFIG